MTRIIPPAESSGEAGERQPEAIRNVLIKLLPRAPDDLPYWFAMLCSRDRPRGFGWSVLREADSAMKKTPNPSRRLMVPVAVDIGSLAVHVSRSSTDHISGLGFSLPYTLPWTDRTSDTPLVS